MDDAVTSARGWVTDGVKWIRGKACGAAGKAPVPRFHLVRRDVRGVLGRVGDRDGLASSLGALGWKELTREALYCLHRDLLLRLRLAIAVVRSPALMHPEQ